MSESNPAIDAAIRYRVVPVLSVEDVDAAEPLARALVGGGLPVAEITLRTAAALDVIERIATIPGMVVGAGTVTTPDQVHDASAAGAAFLVSPGLATDVVAAAHDLGIPMLPGVATPTELMQAVRCGISTVKLFPADILGGLAAVRALAGPFPDVRFVPTGGISAETAPEYLAHRSVAAVGGSWIAPADVIRRGGFDEIQERAAQARRLGAHEGPRT